MEISNIWLGKKSSYVLFLYMVLCKNICYVCVCVCVCALHSSDCCFAPACVMRQSQLRMNPMSVVSVPSPFTVMPSTQCFSIFFLPFPYNLGTFIYLHMRNLLYSCWNLWCHTHISMNTPRTGVFSVPLTLARCVSLSLPLSFRTRIICKTFFFGSLFYKRVGILEIFMGIL